MTNSKVVSVGGSGMTTQRRFNKGDVLFRQGDVSDSALRVSSGEIEVLREVGTASVVLGHVRAGEWLGEMGVVENRSRSATARAVTDCTVEVLTARQFLDRVSSDPNLARELILRLSIRLRKIEDKITHDLLPMADDHSPDASEGMASPSFIPTIQLAAQTDVLRARIGAAPIEVTDLPYIVGRVPARGEDGPERGPDLLIEDEKPFRLSRHHFMITRSDNDLVITDLDSTLGTIANEHAIGHHFMRHTAPLRRGENRIVAGGRGSPFEFTVSVGHLAEAPNARILLK
jgi:CRP/FNR family transcriptional regulator, cyclic AMP receptor protein